MNTRLQVEHPVTEMITGLDLVALQIRVATGEKLPLTQSDVRLNGHAIEVRLYAEAPHKGFLPQSGLLALWLPPMGEGIRVDHGLHHSGQVISLFYDPMIAKINAHGATREEARRRLIVALEHCVALGIETNRGFLIDLLRHADFAAGRATTRFIPQHFETPAVPVTDDTLLNIAALLWFERAAAACGHDPAANWSSTGRLASPVLLQHGEAKAKRVVAPLGGDRYRVDGQEIAVLRRDGHRLRLQVDGQERDVVFAFTTDSLHLALGGAGFRLPRHHLSAAGRGRRRGRAWLRAPMNGKIVAVLAEGETVKKGQRLVIMEAMKMQHEMVARVDAVVEKLPVKVGDQVATRQLLAALNPAAE